MEWLNSFSGFISLAGFIPYIWAISQNKTRPHAISWLIWAIIGFIIFISYYSLGVPYSALAVPFAYVLGPIIITALAFYYGEMSWSRFDLFCLFGGLVGICLWLLTGEPMAALLLNIAVDFFAALPTVRKVYHDPFSEDLTAWSFFLAGGLLNVFTLAQWNFAILSYPLYLCLVAITIEILILRKYFLSKKNSQ